MDFIMNNKLLTLIILSLCLLTESCESPVDPSPSASVSFQIKFNKSINKNSRINPFSKVTAPSDLKIICIDATNYSDSTELSNTLNESMYRASLRYPPLDTIQDFYDYLNQFLEKKFYGNFTKNWEINFDLSTDTSKEVSVSSGLNLFLFFTNENNSTIYSGSVLKTISKNKDNTIEYILNNANKSLEGNIRDATNNKPISGATIKIFQGPELIGNSLSDEFGRYSFYGIPDGVYSIETVKTGYIDNSDSININTDNRFTNIILSPKSGDIDFRVVLEWGKSPLDLDSHLKKDNKNVWFGYIGNKGSTPFAFLDIDDVNGYGPETITIYKLNNDTCKFYVKNFTETPDITTSKAVITLYTGSGFLRRYRLPNSGTGLYWYVFDITPDGNIVSKNFITSEEP